MRFFPIPSSWSRFVEPAPFREALWIEDSCSPVQNIQALLFLPPGDIDQNPILFQLISLLIIDIDNLHIRFYLNEESSDNPTPGSVSPLQDTKKGAATNEIVCFL
jgi:hypothetical protein